MVAAPSEPLTTRSEKLLMHGSKFNTSRFSLLSHHVEGDL